MKLALRNLAAVPCMALLLAVAPVAHADTIVGSVWELPTFTTVPALGSSVYGTTPTATFTLTNSSAANILNLYSVNDVGLSSFLTTQAPPGSGSNGNTLVYLTGSGAAGDNINNDLFEFQGTTTLANGSYNFEHDDGLLFYLTGNGMTNGLVINAPGPTSATATAFTVCASGCDATAGTYSYSLLYAEVDGAPAELLTNLPLVSTSPVPEPGSIALLGTGLLAAAGAVRRRMKS